MKITINGQAVEAAQNATVYDAAKEAELITREHIAALVNGQPADLTAELSADADVKLLAFEDEEGRHIFNHTAAHILAQAVKRLYPDVKLTIGPAIDKGFYYDFDSEQPFTADTLTALEAEMKKIVKENLRIERFTLSREEAVKLMQERGESYKVELIEELPEGKEVRLTASGEAAPLSAVAEIV